MKAEDAEEFTQALAQVFSGGYRLILDAQRRGIPEALGVSTSAWVNDRLGGYVKMNIPDRKKAVAELTKEGLSTRQIGDVLGVTHPTVIDDQRSNAGKNLPPEPTQAGTGHNDAGKNLPSEPHTEAELKTRARSQRDEKAAARREDRDRREAKVQDVPTPDVRAGTLSVALADVTDLDLVLTDPPYPREFLPAWGELARWCAQALKPGALLVAYSGQYHLPEVLTRLSAHLEYQWLGWLKTTGPQVAVHKRPIMSGGKPLLIFSNGPLKEPFSKRRFFDSVDSEGRTRERHTWEQSEGPVASLMDALTERGEYVADPFLGSGTVAAVAQKLGRRFVGCDVDTTAVQTTRERLAA